MGTVEHYWCVKTNPVDNKGTGILTTPDLSGTKFNQYLQSQRISGVLQTDGNGMLLMIWRIYAPSHQQLSRYRSLVAHINSLRPSDAYMRQ